MVKHTFKFLTILLFTIFFESQSFNSYCQTQSFTYNYDESGNRTARVIGLVKGFDSDSQQELEFNITETAGIKIYPNPTKGLLKISIRGYEDGATFNFKLYDIKGAQLISKKTMESQIELNLSEHKSGIYILHLSIGDQILKWKIIKV